MFFIPPHLIDYTNDSPIDQARVEMIHPVCECFFLAEMNTNIPKRCGIIPRLGKVSVNPQAASVSVPLSIMTVSGTKWGVNRSRAGRGRGKRGVGGVRVLVIAVAVREFEGEVARVPEARHGNHEVGGVVVDPARAVGGDGVAAVRIGLVLGHAVPRPRRLAVA